MMRIIPLLGLVEVTLFGADSKLGTPILRLENSSNSSNTQCMVSSGAKNMSLKVTGDVTDHSIEPEMKAFSRSPASLSQFGVSCLLGFSFG
ncbi:hypothetical protein SADUNF_Sadunf05G0029300 [Salix dunnii]|uniref:Uncharacterized protein n=1 Tax=Salix dunnii TaxID=1413687 RepID=A0A835MYH9_9ROSI|nr:hypothetical protein SADUNF_Sadunf05G0029300 [Salix dunnii]